MSDGSTSAASPFQVEPRFLACGNHRLLAVHWTPSGSPRGTVVCVPPFAEEMNRCRTHVADTARALAVLGWQCVVPDLYGTGESEGTYETATWDTWVAELQSLLAGLPAQGGPTVLWGIRTGALLAASVAAEAPSRVSHLLFWQPVLDGNLFMNQYLRLRIASQMVHAGEKETTDELRRRLAAGETLEIAGYPLAGPLALAIDAQKMASHASRLQQGIHWLEVVAQPGGAALPASRKLIESWPRPIALETVHCPMVWQVYDRMNAPELVGGTVRLLQNIAP